MVILEKNKQLFVCILFELLDVLEDFQRELGIDSSDEMLKDVESKDLVVVVVVVVSEPGVLSCKQSNFKNPGLSCSKDQRIKGLMPGRALFHWYLYKVIAER